MGSAAAGVAMTGAPLATLPAGFHVPAEEDHHERTFMQWPVNRRVHPDDVFLDMTQQTIADVANPIAQFEPVTMLAHADDHAGARVKLASNVELLYVPTEDLWCRDAGPLFAKGRDGSPAASHIRFNGWGEKQANTLDSQIAAEVARHLGSALSRRPVVSLCA